MTELEHFTKEAQAQVNAALESAETARSALAAANEELRAANARSAALVAENARLRARITDLLAHAESGRQSLDIQSRYPGSPPPDYAPGKPT